MVEKNGQGKSTLGGDFFLFRSARGISAGQAARGFEDTI